MMTRLLLIAMVFVCSAVPGFAHRLDEYLQAATIQVSEDHVVVQLRLTPGISVAPQLLSGIDGDGDGILSAIEQQAYAERVRQNLSLSLDGQPEPLRLVSASFPDIGQLANGTGDIDLRFEAAVPAGDPVHRLDFENHHLRAFAVYLVNTLLPRDPAIRIVSQDRSYDQSSYHLAFTRSAAPEGGNSVTRQQRLDLENGLAIIGSYFWHGVHHILTGYDHLLFVSALVLGAATLWDLVKVVTAFTVAHSITLTLAALNLVNLPDVVVEPLISASIVFVAVQNFVSPEQSGGGSRLAVAFFFGLFHGLGFAGGLLEVMHQMPTRMILVAILGFSLGVEVGNQMVLLPLFGALQLVRSTHSKTELQAHPSRTVQQVGSAGISAAGAYYLFTALTGGS